MLFRSQATTTVPGGVVTTGTNLSTSVVGTSFTLTATTLNTLYQSGSSAGAFLYGTITITGRDSGARLTIPLKIKKI